MADRLVLGSGSPGHSIVETLHDRPGRVRVVTADEGWGETFLEAGIAVEVADPTDPATLRELDAPEVVVVADDDPDRNVRLAATAREVFPDVLLVAYAGWDGTEGAVALGDIADRVVDPGRATAGFLLERVGGDGLRLRQLQRVLRGIDDLAVVTHDNPDPDAIGSAVALARLAERVGCGTDVCYYGDITHQENRAFVNLLGFDLTNLGPDADLSAYDGFALVDHSRPGVNDQLPGDLAVDVVIDHHPPRSPVEARFVDLRSEVGATSTLLVDYLEHLCVPFAEDVATGLLFGIRVDTKGFTRETSRADFEAAATLLPHADLGTLERIESPSISPETFATIADAIRNRRHAQRTILSCVGLLSDRDALAQAADRLLTMEDVTTSLVYGFRDGTIYVSARSRGSEVDLGETLRDAFGRIGSAGGHADMGGAQIRLGVLEAADAREESLTEVVEAVVTNRFLDALRTRSNRAITRVYAGEHGADEYRVPEDELPIADADDGRAESESPETGEADGSRSGGATDPDSGGT